MTVWEYKYFEGKEVKSDDIETRHHSSHLQHWKNIVDVLS